MENIRFEENTLTAEQYTLLHKACGFKFYEIEDIKLALTHTLYTVTLYDDANIIGMARIVGDGRLVFFLKDIMVIPTYRRSDLGTRIMHHIFAYIDSVACEGAYIGLMSTPGKEAFYKKFGFIERPSEGLGSGMVLFYEK